MKEPAQLDDGRTLILKTKFENFIKFESYNKEIERIKMKSGSGC